MVYKFLQARPVWSPDNKNQWNQFVGFVTRLHFEEPTKVKIALTARSYYRLYINGERAAHGPARTARGYLRVDEYEQVLSGDVYVAVEVASYNKPDRYSNTIPLEPGLFIGEIAAGDQVLAATGANHWQYVNLYHRREMVELMSHSREIMEVYDLDEAWLSWTQSGMQFGCPTVLNENPVFLTRRAPYPDYKPASGATLIRVGDIVSCEPDFSVIGLQQMMQPKWYGQLKDFIIPAVAAEGAACFSGNMCSKFDDAAGGAWNVSAVADKDCFLIWDMGQAITGFTHVCLTVDENCVVDVVNSDRLDKNGLTEENMLVRYHLQAGTYTLTSFEPYFFRYIKLIFRGANNVKISEVSGITFWYPDCRSGSFACSDGQLNAIYEAARRTLQANTMDIFMDCPQRERGGWLCDSLWTSRAARMMFGNTLVEEDFIENFMLTDGDFYKYSVFPEVYPGNSRNDSGDPGILNWSFWLGLEICEYYQRSGNKVLVMQWYDRIAKFVEGTRSLIGASGLLENIPAAFVDWSQANMPMNTQPISLPINCLYAYMLESLARVYDNAKWQAMAEKHWDILKTVPGAMSFGPSGMKPANYADALNYEDGKFKPGATMSEAAMFLEVWSGLAERTENRGFKRNVIKTMGTCPQEPGNIMLGKSDLFIGLAIRHDMLSKADEIDTLVAELKNVYLPQIEYGPGTLFENMTGYASRCHGFNGHAGVLLMRDILGLHEPDAVSKTIRIAPHLCGLQWASGKTACGNGFVTVDWQADDYEKTFVLNVNRPKDYSLDIILPEELFGWRVSVNEK